MTVAQMTLDDVQSDNSTPTEAPTKRKYTMTEKVIQAKQNQSKSYNISDINRSYLDSFQQAKYTNDKQRASWNQYKSTCNNFLASLGKDAAMTKREDIETFLEPFKDVTRTNKAAHIKAFLIHMITANVKNCTSKIGRDLLIKLLEM